MSFTPPSSPSPPPPPNQRKTDADHLKLLAIFHFVTAGLSLLGLGFIIVHAAIMLTVFSNPENFQNSESGPPPEEIFIILRILYIVLGLFAILHLIGNVFSGLFLLKRKARTFSMIMAGINCLAFPFGTVLGVFTILVLGRPTVREVYAEVSAAGSGGTFTNAT